MAASIDSSGILEPVPTAARVARNESLFREVNERILELEESFGDPGHGGRLIAIVCECATTGCTTKVEVSPEEYLQAREKPTRFIVALGHVDLEFERVVIETERFLLIEKLAEAGETAAKLAD
jgi:hypothetical protein